MRHGLFSVSGKEKAEELIRVTLGKEKADLAIINAAILNVYTGELLEHCSVTIKGEWIAYVGDDPGDMTGPHTKIIDARGKAVIPGLIDGHTHLAWPVTVSEFLQYAMLGGTTTIITETMESFAIMGYEGVVDFLASLEEQPIKIFATAPSMASISNMVREGSIRRDLAPISRIKDAGVDLRRLILVTDGVEPGDLLEKGYMEFVVQKAIDCGFDPVHAIQMATINVAEYFFLDGILGGIAPGKYADMLIIPDPKNIKAEYVISKGKIIAREGNLLISPRKHVFSPNSLNSIHLLREFEASDFSIPVKKNSSRVNVRVIDQVTDLVTKELVVSVPVIDGEIRSDVSTDISKVAAVDRRYSPGKTFVGLIKGFRLSTGAIACSGAWDTSDIIVVGENNRDMAGAVNRVYALQGGAVVCAKGKVLAEIPLPVFGIMADMPVAMLAKRMEEIKRVMKGLGFPFDNPLLTLVTLTGAAIPFLRICEEGLVNLRDGKTLGLIVD